MSTKQPKVDWVEEKPMSSTKKSLKDMWDSHYGEGTSFDLDYGKLAILFLCVYIAVQVS